MKTQIHKAILALALCAGFFASAASAQSSLSLSWQDNSENEEGFEVERAIGGAGWQTIATLPQDATAYTDASPDLVEGFFVSYRVRAYNRTGFSDYSNTATATVAPARWFIPFAPSDAPGAVTALQVSHLTINAQSVTINQANP